jgi:membrane protein insertase, YidC/Oxa1 family, C-terminal domain
MSWLMEPIYNIISWVLLRWHELWALLLPGDGRFLGTSWEWVLAIVFLVVTVRLVLFPLFVKQIKSQRAMQALAPKIRELQAKHKNDPVTLREEMMKLYQQEKVNPLMGCLPMLLQIPVFFGLFHVLKYINPLNTQPKNPDGPPRTLYGWTADLFDSASAAHLFGAPIPATFADPADKLQALGAASVVAPKIVAAALVLTMMFTTFMTSRQMILKTGWQAEPQQRMIQRLMLYFIPLSLLVSGWLFPIGVIIYWVTQNLISLGQQQWVLRKYPPVVTTPEPKSARERAALAEKKQHGPILRFFLAEPPPPKPAGAETKTKRGWFAKLRRSSAAEPVAPAPKPDPRALAPRPGAKPRAVTSGSPAAAKPADAATTTTAKVTPTKGAVKATPTKTTAAKPGSGKAASAQASATKATSAGATTAAADAAEDGSAVTVGATPSTPPPLDEVSPNGATVRSGAPRAAARSGGGRSGGGNRKSAARRKGGQPARKGGKR